MKAGQKITLNATVTAVKGEDVTVRIGKVLITGRFAAKTSSAQSASQAAPLAADSTTDDTSGQDFTAQSSTTSILDFVPAAGVEGSGF